MGMGVGAGWMGDRGGWMGDRRDWMGTEGLDGDREGGLAPAGAVTPPLVLQKEQAEEYEARQHKGIKRSELVEKAQEAASLIAQRAVNPRDIFKQREKSVPEDVALAVQPGTARGVCTGTGRGSGSGSPVVPVLVTGEAEPGQLITPHRYCEVAHAQLIRFPCAV